MIIKRLPLIVLACISLATGAARAQTQPQGAPPPATKVRAVIEAVNGDTVVLKDRDGDTVNVTMDAQSRISGIKAVDISEITPGSFIGCTSVAQPDGTAKALGVTVFPPSMKGMGEGSYPWDLAANSTMTNGTVGAVVVSNGRVMTVNYNGTGEKQITVPVDAPVVTVVPGDRSLLTPGAHIMVFAAKAADGVLTARFMAVGENGITPPM